MSTASLRGIAPVGVMLLIAAGCGAPDVAPPSPTPVAVTTTATTTPAVGESVVPVPGPGTIVPVLASVAAELTDPASGSLIHFSNQPITLRFVHARAIPDTASLAETLEVSSDEQFATTAFTRAFSRDETAVVVLPSLPRARYYWRVRATVGGFAAETSAVWTFVVDEDPPRAAPILLAPADGAVIQVSTQPVSVTFVNGRAPAPDEVVHTIDVGRDAQFTSVAQTMRASRPGPVQTTVNLSRLPMGSYYLRVRTTIAGNPGDVSGTRRFTIGPDFELGAVELTKPDDDAIVDVTNLSFNANRAERDWGKTLVSRLEVATDPVFTSVVFTEASGPTTNVFAGGRLTGMTLPFASTFYWRVVVRDPVADITGSSPTRRFQTTSLTVDGLASLHIGPVCGRPWMFDGTLTVDNSNVRFTMPTLVLELTPAAGGLSGTAHGRARARYEKVLDFLESLQPGRRVGDAAFSGTAQPDGRFTGVVNGLLYFNDGITSIVNCPLSGAPWTIYPAGR